jgi:hypothetical protein
MSDYRDSEFYKGLPEDIKEQLEKCQSEEEAMDVLKHNMIETTDEALDEVAGGWCMTKGKKCICR